jgi:hypothetical protein
MINQKSTLLVLAGDGYRDAMNAALRHAQSTSKQLSVIQVLNSDLYHYGHQDLVATRSSKRQFLLHVRDEVIKRGEEEIRALEEAAQTLGVSLEISSVESEDIYSTCLSEAQKGYDSVFVSKQKSRIFPLFKKTLAEYLRKKTKSRVISC